jgi:hypothetical protein
MSLKATVAGHPERLNAPSTAASRIKILPNLPLRMERRSGNHIIKTLIKTVTKHNIKLMRRENQ